MEFVPGEFSLKWDNINEYEKILQRSFNKEIKLGSFEGLSKKVDMSPLAIVLNVLETKKRNLLNRLSYSVLITSFSVSIAILIFKMIVSKKI